jgi:hypothetical protein
MVFVSGKHAWEVPFKQNYEPSVLVRPTELSIQTGDSEDYH